MSDDVDSTLTRFKAEDARPATFLERGVSVPFTTPILLGARARPAERRGLELAIPNPSGARGLYIVPLGSLPDICNPTLHDRQICEVIAATPAITPDGMLRIARDVACKGLAGRGPAKAAAAADQADAEQRLITNYQLLMRLIEQTESAGESTIPAARDTAANVKLRSRRAIARTAPSLGLPSDTVVSGLEALADIYAPVGFCRDPTSARYQRQLRELENLAASVQVWAEMAVDGQETKAAFLVARSAELTLACSRPIMENLLSALDNIGELVRRWAQKHDEFLELIARPAWLLDGWSIPIGLWRSVNEEGRANVIREMSAVVPSMPIEVDSWEGGNRERFEMVYRSRSRIVFRLQEWRSGNMVQLIERNEKLVRDVV